ncbi:MAG: DNA polymerase III subunit alpha, partial [Candidatus Moranbacteria bacterium]|nr:DNA polymerase III subunit alpha [Candidatus Moranbacteria bacterium]
EQDKIRYHITLLVKNEKGYKNLMKLVSIAHLDGFYYKPRIDKKTLKKYSEGLIAMSGCIQGEVPQAVVNHGIEKATEVAKEYEGIFGKGNFYMEVQHLPTLEKQTIANAGMIEISKKEGIPIVATGDIHYANKDDAESQDILLCIQTNRKVHEENRMKLLDYDLSMKSQEEMIRLFKDNPEAIENTQKIVDACNFEITLGETQLPQFEVPEGHTDETFLRKMTEDGLHKKFKKEEITQEHIDRMNFELSIIEKMGFPSYFLIVQDFVNWAKGQGIVVGPGRGSAAGSFVSYLIGITNIDPIKYDLLFERFLNPERVSMPDVDMDFADDRRDEVLDYVRKKYGNDHVAQIITFGTMAARAAIRDTGRALDYPYEFCDRASKMIPMFSSIEEALDDVPEFKQFYDTEAGAKKLVDSAKKLEGVARHASMHACGVVITKNPVTEYTPLQNITGSREGTVTQYASSTKYSVVEKIGLLKMDFLGLKNLTIIQNTLNILKNTKGVNIDIENIDLEDEKTYQLLQEAKTTGVFQLESSGMKRYLKQLKPTNLEDVIAMVALYRPGPMDWIPDFIDRKHGRKKIQYLHPKLEPILNKTYGVAVYQEQVMQIAQQLAGYSLGGADMLRKAMGKKIMELIQEEKKKFIEGAFQNGIDKKTAEGIFAFIEPFAGYGFNRSHAACYGLIGYQTAFLKAHYPAEFMAALMTSDQDNTDRIAIEVDESEQMGIEVLPPHINESFEEFTVVKNNEDTECIRFGLNAIKNVGHTVAHEIVAERKKNGPFESLEDLIDRVTTKDLNKKSIEALAKVGALEGIGERNQIIENIELIINFSKSIHKEKNSNQTSLFGEDILEKPKLLLPEKPHSTKKQRLQWEKELLGLYVSDHPVGEFQEYFDNVATPIKSLSEKHVGRQVQIGGVISSVKKIITKRKQNMAFVSIEDLKGKMEILVFPYILEKTESIWKEDNIILAEGKISDKDGSFKLLADDAKLINKEEVETYQRILETQRKNGSLPSQQIQSKEIQQAETQAESVQEISEKQNFDSISKLIVSLPSSTNQETMQKLSSIFDSCEFGTAKIFVQIGNQKLETNYTIKITDNILRSIKRIAGENSINLA